MNRKYSNKPVKNDMSKIMDYYRILDTIVIENKDYREVFDNAMQFAYGKSLDEYYDKNIDTIMVNNIRHNYSNYDQITRIMHRVRRCNMDYEQYKNSVLDKISVYYPLLRDECDRQKYKLDMVKICK